MIGDEVIPVRQMLDIKYPMKEGIIQDIDDLEKIWRYALTNKVKNLTKKINFFFRWILNPKNFPITDAY